MTETQLTHIADGEKLYATIEAARKAARQKLRGHLAQQLELVSINVFHDPDTEHYFVCHASGIGAGEGTYEPVETVFLEHETPWVRRFQGGDRGHFKGKTYYVIDVGREGFNGYQCIFDEGRERLASFIKRCSADGLDIIAYKPDERYAYARPKEKTEDDLRYANGKYLVTRWA